jgi:hypothetical protein
MKRALEPIKTGRSHKIAEGLNVKIRERITRFQREGGKPKHVRELFAGG